MSNVSINVMSKVSPEVIKNVSGGRMCFSIFDNWYFISYSKFKIPIGSKMEYNGDTFELLMISDQFGHTHRYIPLGWKVIALFDKEIKGLSVQNGWIPTKNSVNLILHEEI